MMESRREFRLAMLPVIAGLLVVPWSRHLSGWMPAGDVGAFVPMVVLTLVAGLMALGGGGARQVSEAIRDSRRMMLCMIPLGLAVLTAVMVAGSGDLMRIAQRQAADGMLWLAFHDPFCMTACVLFFLVSVVCLRVVMVRGVALLLCAVMAVLWLGAWYDPFGGVAWLEETSQPRAIEFHMGWAFAANMVGLAVFVAKLAFLMAAMKFVAGLLPKWREGAAFEMVLPVSLGGLLAEAVYLWLTAPLADVRVAMQWVLMVVGWLGVAGTLAYRLAAKRTSVDLRSTAKRG
ncbi:MAG: NADH-quinone oxidoreductase subunit H [Phycisphaerales bacterium]|nr:NADH-quinone oxidoreductase subunit H [Phycisphaerales bacterium]